MEPITVTTIDMKDQQLLPSLAGLEQPFCLLLPSEKCDNSLSLFCGNELALHWFVNIVH
jgi:hypothetical protein